MGLWSGCAEAWSTIPPSEAKNSEEEEDADAAAPPSPSAAVFEGSKAMSKAATSDIIPPTEEEARAARSITRVLEWVKALFLVHFFLFFVIWALGATFFCYVFWNLDLPICSFVLFRPSIFLFGKTTCPKIEFPFR